MLKSAVAFVEGVSQQVRDTKQLRTDQPLLYLKLQTAQIKLQAGDVAGCKTIIEDGKEELESMQDVSSTLLECLQRSFGLN